MISIEAEDSVSITVRLDTKDDVTAIRGILSKCGTEGLEFEEFLSIDSKYSIRIRSEKYFTDGTFVKITVKSLNVSTIAIIKDELGKLKLEADK